jgi:GNAT superfamily N-acetyltransferase
VSAGIVVREVAPAELEVLGELTVAAYREVGETDEPYYAELRDVASRAARVPVLVAVDAADGRLLGGMTYVPGPGPFAEGDFGDAATFRMLAVDPAARGRGAGRALVEAAIARARADGRTSIGIFTRPFMGPRRRSTSRWGSSGSPASTGSSSRRTAARLPAAAVSPARHRPPSGRIARRASRHARSGGYRRPPRPADGFESS